MNILKFIAPLLLLILYGCTASLPRTQITDFNELIEIFGHHIVFEQCAPSDFIYVADLQMTGTQNEEGLFVYNDNSEFRLFTSFDKPFTITEQFLNNDVYYIDFEGKFSGWMLKNRCAPRYYTGAFFSQNSIIEAVNFSGNKGG